MKKTTKKLQLKASTIRNLSSGDLRGAAGAMSGNVRCSASGCASYACSKDVMGCGTGDTSMQCTGASDMWCVTQMGGC